jgi:sugar O-acyltransferase (sialic acid O-acetyltransferase NeuD family)
MPSEPAPTVTERGIRTGATALVVLGGGEHARVVIDAAATSGDWHVDGYVAPGEARPPMDLPWLGDDASLAARLADDQAAADRPSLVLGFGGGDDAASLAARMAVADGFGPAATWATIIHATAWVSPGAMVEPGVVILAHAVVNHGARIGRHAIVNSGAIVEHDVVVGAGSHVAPGVVIGGAARIGRGAFIGLGSRIRDRIEIGDGAVVGMGAVVVASVAAGATVVGIPARASGRTRA